MATAETVSYEIRNFVEYVLCDLNRHASPCGALHERVPHGCHIASVPIFWYIGSEIISILQRHTRKFVRNLQDLLLEEDNAIGIGQYWLQVGMIIDHRLFATAPTDKRMHHIAL